VLADALERPLRLTARPCGETITALGVEAVIPSKRSCKIIIPHDELACINRNRIARCFNRMKHFRRFARRCDPKNHSLQRLRLYRCRNDLASVNVDSSQLIAAQDGAGVVIYSE
jgi:transposase